MIHTLLVRTVVCGMAVLEKKQLCQAQTPDPLAKLPVVFNVRKLYKAGCEHHLQM